MLSLRKETKGEYEQSVQSSMMHYYNKMVSQRESVERKRPKNLKSLMTKNRINTAVPSNKDSISVASNQRAKTKEGQRQRLIPESAKSTNFHKHSNCKLRTKNLEKIRY